MNHIASTDTPPHIAVPHEHVRIHRSPLPSHRHPMHPTVGDSKWLQLRQSTTLLEDNTQELDQVLTHAATAIAAKSQFLANVSHELRTPLNGIIGMTRLLLETRLTEEQYHFMEIVRSSGESLLSLVNDILDFSKIEAGKLALETVPFAVRDVIEDTMEMLAFHALDKQLELTYHIDAAVPTTLSGDPRYLRQILLNLGNNAIKFTEQGEVALHVSVATRGLEVIVLRFAVHDNGIGIPPEQRDHLFQPFAQLTNGLNHRQDGTGLGLAIAKQLVTLMHGLIGVDSQLGHGATFWFTAEFGRIAQAVPAPLLPASPLCGVSVLVVDDHATNRQLLTTLLSQWGCQVTAVASGQAAQQQLTTTPAQIVLIDCKLPDGDGLQWGPQLKRSAHEPTPRLVLLASLVERGAAIYAEQAGFDGYLTKPLRQHLVHDCLVQVLAQSAATSTPHPIVVRHTLADARRALQQAVPSAAHLLLVEDNRTNQLVARAMLGKLGYQNVDIANNGREALVALARQHYDLVLMDGRMPELDGFETTRQIRAGAAGAVNQQVPIVAMTALAMTTDRQRCLDAGMNGYLSKPVHPLELAQVIAAQLTPSAPTAAPEPVFAPAKLLTCVGERSIAQAIVEQFLVDIRQRHTELVASLAVADWAAARFKTHSIKGLAATVAALPLYDCAAQLETQLAAEPVDPGATAPLRQALTAAIAQLEPVLRDWLAQ